MYIQDFPFYILFQARDKLIRIVMTQMFILRHITPLELTTFDEKEVVQLIIVTNRVVIILVAYIMVLLV